MPTPPLGNKRLPPFGTDSEKLTNGRYRIVRRWMVTDENTVPSNKELDLNYFEEFGTEDLTPYGQEPADLLTDYRFADCRLVKQYTTFPPGLGFQLFVKEYETLTDSWELEDDDKTSSTENGLRLLTRSQVAKPGTEPPYDEDDVGVATMGGGFDSFRFPESKFNGHFIEQGTFNGRPQYIMPIASTPPDDLPIIYWNPSRVAWTMGTVNDGDIYYATGDEPTPDISIIWYKASNDDPITSIPSVTLRKELTLAGFQDDSDDRRGAFVTKWVEPGTLSVSTQTRSEGVQQKTYTFLGVDATPQGSVIVSKREGDYEGFRTITVSVLVGSDGDPLVGSGGAAKLNTQYQQLVPFTLPGVVDLVREQNHIFPSVRSPVQTKVVADVLVYYQGSGDIVPSDFTIDGAEGLWNPAEWAQKISTIDAFMDDNNRVNPAYFNAQGLRGVRTRESYKVTGDHGMVIDATDQNYTPATLELEESTEEHNGRSTYVYKKNYTYDITTGWTVSNGINIIQGPYKALGELVVTCQWNGSQWELVYTQTVTDPTPEDSNAGDNRYTHSSRTDTWTDTYSDQSYTNTGTIETASGGGITPDAATWSGINFSSPSREESLDIGSLDGNVNYNIDRFGGWIEGRNVDNGANGSIQIKGGPKNPFGRRYVLDVVPSQAIEDIDGNIIYMKKVVVATIIPA